MCANRKHIYVIIVAHTLLWFDKFDSILYLKYCYETLVIIMKLINYKYLENIQNFKWHLRSILELQLHLILNLLSQPEER